MKRQKYIKDEQNGLTYTLVGDYYVPDISIDDVELKPIGRWGRLHRDYLQEHNSLLYNQLLLSGRLYKYLVDLN